METNVDMQNALNDSSNESSFKQISELINIHITHITEIHTGAKLER